MGIVSFITLKMEFGDKKLFRNSFSTFFCIFALPNTVDVAQSVRASDCGSEGRGFESHLPPQKPGINCRAFLFIEID